MKIRKTRVVAVLAILLLILPLMGCGADERKLQDKLSSGTQLTNKIEPDGETPVLHNDRIAMYLDENMAVRLVDTETGQVWSTNPETLDGGVTHSQFTLSYYDATGAYSTMSSREDCVDKGQATAYLEGESLFVEYRLGNYEQTLSDVPNSMRDERFRSCFLDKLTEEEAAEFQSFYKYYEKEDMWAIRAKGKNNVGAILAFMQKVGYTTEDLAQDNADFGIATVSQARPQFTVVLEYHLDEAGFTVRVPSERIAFSSKYPLYELNLLDSFGSQQQDADGYMFLPDGCGVLMPFSTSYDQRSVLTMPVYGLDMAVASDTLSAGQWDYEKVTLPVFGMKDGDGAFLAVISGAASKATVCAHPGGTYFPRNAVYVTFRMISKDNVYLTGSDTTSSVIMFQNSLFEEDCAVSYRFLEKGSGYVEMAAAYRQELLDSGMLTPVSDKDDAVPLLIETIGGVVGYENFLGFSYKGIHVGTAYEENAVIADELLAGGVEALEMRLAGWFNGGMYHSYPDRISLTGVLGGKKGWKALMAYAAEKSVMLYPDIDFLQATGKGSFSAGRDAARRLDFSEASMSVLSRATLSKKSDLGLTPMSFYLLSPSKLQQLSMSFLKAYAVYNTGGLSLRTSGNLLYSDFRDTDTVDRTKAVESLVAHLAQLKEAGTLMVNEGFAYALPYADRIANIPLESSGYNSTGETVPFLQMVLHGSKRMYGEPVNLAVDPEEYVLRSIEYGVSLQYQVTYRSSDVLKNTEYTENYAAGYQNWKEDMLAAYNKMKDVLSGLEGSTITDHEKIDEGVYCTVYEDGTRVYVNYTGQAAAVEGGTVESGSCLRVNG